MLSDLEEDKNPWKERVLSKRQRGDTYPNSPMEQRLEEERPRAGALIRP